MFTGYSRTGDREESCRGASVSSAQLHPGSVLQAGCEGELDSITSQATAMIHACRYLDSLCLCFYFLNNYFMYILTDCGVRLQKQNGNTASGAA